MPQFGHAISAAFTSPPQCLQVRFFICLLSSVSYLERCPLGYLLWEKVHQNNQCRYNVKVDLH